MSYPFENRLEAILKMPNGSFDRLMTLSTVEGRISGSGLNRNNIRIQGVKGSSKFKSEYRISNKKCRIMKFFFPSIFIIPCSIFCGSI